MPQPSDHVAHAEPGAPATRNETGVAGENTGGNIDQPALGRFCACSAAANARLFGSGTRVIANNSEPSSTATTDKMS